MLDKTKIHGNSLRVKLNIPETKNRCRICKEIKDKDFFSEGMKNASISKAECRECCKKRHLAYMQNPAKKKRASEIAQKWQKDNKDKARATYKRYIRKPEVWKKYLAYMRKRYARLKVENKKSVYVG